MAIKFSCGSCGKKFLARDEHAGRSSKCPACGWPIAVPAAINRETHDSSPATPPPLPVASPPAPSAEDHAPPERWTLKIGAPEIAGLAILVFVGVFSIGWDLTHRPATQASAAAWTAPARPPERDASGPRYRILKADINEAALSEWGKDIFSIRLSRKVSEVVLKDIVREIMDNKPCNPRTG